MGTAQSFQLGAAEIAPVTPNAASPAVDFNTQIAPLLTQHCYKCHGAEKQESGLRLDQRAAALAGGQGDYGPTIVPGHADQSTLIAVLTGARDDLPKMPPKGDPLTADQIALLSRWIDQGANWPEAVTSQQRDPRAHWAFRAPHKPALPSVAQLDWLRNPIDAFILGRLAQEKLNPSPEADRTTLLRRLSLDLIGLPPTIAEVDEFLADPSPDAYLRQVERLLASPHYGERWGRHWLDAARYADSDGYEKDKSRNVWMYRDWVVGALNRDLPYDQFIIEQIAGDLLPEPTQDQCVATGFLRNSMLNEEGGVDPEQFRMDAMFDRMDAVGKAVLGLTIQCAQCHNHKFDPISQADYYRLFAFLNNDHEPQMVVYAPDELMARDQLVMQMRQIEAELKETTPDWPQRLAAWETQLAASQPTWTILEPSEYQELGGGAKVSLLPDQSMLCAGYAPTHCTFRATGPLPAGAITGIRLEALTNPNLPCRGPGRSFKGTFGLTEIKVEAATPAEPGKKNAVAIAQAIADYSQPQSPLEPAFDDRSKRDKTVGPIAFAFDGKDETAWAIDAGPGRRNQDRTAIFQFAEPIKAEAGAPLSVSLVQNHGGWNSDDHQNNLIGCFRVAFTTSPNPAAAPAIPRRIREILDTPAAQRSPTQQAALFSFWRETVAEWSEANARIEALWQQWPAGSTALVLEQRPEPRTTRMLHRGDFLKPKDAVAAGTPDILHPFPADAPLNRLTLAHWLVDRSSPTTARVAVNRIWQQYFGTGLVGTSEDFGTQGDLPSHPELLDWLACQFMDTGWSLKQLHRLIVTSATYRQSSHVTPALFERDPYNRLLARGPRVRVEGEIVRDVALAASGLLNPALGGPSVYPPLPESVLLLSYGPMTWNAETGPNRYRRALYTFRRRSIPFPALQNFDAPNGDFACVKRVRSNTPLQALTTLNETLFVEAAQALAKRTLKEGGATDAERLTYAFRRCVSRAPDAQELSELQGLLARQQVHLAQGWTSPLVVATGKQDLPTDLPAGTTPTQLGSYTIVSRVLLNLDETITKE
jgi:mono/diheme cytochrome c family protein/cytochrome c553